MRPTCWRNSLRSGTTAAIRPRCSLLEPDTAVVPGGGATHATGAKLSAMRCGLGVPSEHVKDADGVNSNVLQGVHPHREPDLPGVEGDRGADVIDDVPRAD